MEARKANKVYQIDTEREANTYAAQGYDIYEGGKLVKHAAGKSVPIAEYEKVCSELAEAKAELEAIKAEKQKASRKAK